MSDFFITIPCPCFGKVTGGLPQKSNFYIFDFLGEEDDEDEEELINSLNINRKTA
jgi:hypothetical protein